MDCGIRSSCYFVRRWDPNNAGDRCFGILRFVGNVRHRGDRQKLVLLSQAAAGKGSDLGSQSCYFCYCITTVDVFSLEAM